MAALRSSRSILLEQTQSAPKVASTVLAVGNWLMWNALNGNLTNLLPAYPVEGLNQTPIASTDTDYASNKFINYDTIDKDVDRFSMPVTNGTASTAVVGGVYNVFTDSYGLDVSTYNTLTYNTLAVSTFAAGHTITGTTSSATATISYIGPNNTLVVVPVSGTLIAGEVITDGTSSATARIVTYGTGGTQFEVTQIANSEGRLQVKVVKTA